MDAQPRAFVRHHQLVDGQSLRTRNFQQLRRTVKGIRQPFLHLIRRSRLHAILDDESATNGKEGALIDLGPCSVICRQPQTIRMLRARSRRKHDLALEEQILRLIESDTSYPCELELLRRTDLRHRCLNHCRINRRRLIPRQTQQHGAIRSVSHPGQRKRTKQLHLHAVYTSQVRRSTRVLVQSGTPRASGPSCANSKVQRQVCKDRKDSWSRRRL